METTIQDITGECGGRVIAVSDVHGHGHYLKGLLEAVSFSRQDTLVIVGDIIEKGGDSLATVRYCMGLQRRGYHIYMSAGNVDTSRLGSFFDRSEGHGRRFAEELAWTKKVWKCGLFLEILKELGISPDQVHEENAGEIKDRIAETYREELGFLTGRPVIITCGNYIFVHAGIPTDDLETLKGKDGFQFLKTDAFFTQGYSFRRCVVVGHWPVGLYRKDTDCMNPVFDYERHVAAIDGGCGLKKGCQLNALLIPHPFAAMEEVGIAVYDDYPAVRAKTAQKAEAATIRVRYFDAEVELFSREEEKSAGGQAWAKPQCLTGQGQDGKKAEYRQSIAAVQHKRSGIVFHVPEGYLYRRDEKLFCSDFTNAALQVEAGETIKLIAWTDAGAVVKKDGVIGWYFGDFDFPYSV